MCLESPQPDLCLLTVRNGMGIFVQIGKEQSSNCLENTCQYISCVFWSKGWSAEGCWPNAYVVEWDSGELDSTFGSTPDFQCDWEQVPAKPRICNELRVRYPNPIEMGLGHLASFDNHSRVFSFFLHLLPHFFVCWMGRMLS